ncbi:MAG: hypothetical protein FH762_19465 [Firmicutes bacterium]|nr:hypothetical protein [Bacillota bacterium]
MYLFKNFKKYNKWIDLINIKKFECYFSLFLSLLYILLFNYVQLYEKFNIYEEALRNISLNIISALFGLLGLILAGIAIFIGVLDKDIRKIIEKINNKNNKIDKVLFSFGFLSLVIVSEIIIFITVYILLYSSIHIISKRFFYIVIFIIIYLFLFILFYILSLIGNCIQVYFISNTYKEIINKEKNTYIEINELRIDFMFELLLDEDRKEKFLSNINSASNKKELFVRELINFILRSNVNNKDNIIKYIKKYYNIEG